MMIAIPQSFNQLGKSTTLQTVAIAATPPLVQPPFHLKLSRANRSLQATTPQADSLKAVTKTTGVNAQARRRRRNPFQNFWGVYRGSARIILGFFNGLGGFSRVTQHQTSAIAEIRAPRTAGGVRESNRINLNIGSSPAEIAANVEGAFQIHSAIPYNFRGGFLAQYWRLRVNGNRLNGSLTNPSFGEAIAINLVNSIRNFGLGVVVPWPYAMAQGTTLSGRINRNLVRVRIQGTDSGNSLGFIIDVNVRRR